MQDLLGANVRERGRLYDLSIDGRIFKCILREQDGRVRTELVWLSTETSDRLL